MKLRLTQVARIVDLLNGWVIDNMVPPEDYNAVRMMQIYGGSFVKCLADLLHRADSVNYAKLRIAFNNYFLEYEEMSKISSVGE